MSSQQDAFVTLDDVPADLADFLDAVGHEPLTARMAHATWEITRRGEQFHVECYGSGNGWYNARRMGRRELRAYLRAHEDSLKLKRPEGQRPD
jgi:hypothetical protein